ncbi:type IV leader peptidase family protein [Roseovarius sp. A-2]|uniref:prepilin peptidase n=1 Tax=Roseovarius sp. A-2 TaxID=1570360 RepID=UPI0009B540D2|nr:prepilin peptidase [Roseovarius sp. A-2]GAW34105.1 type IV leader peptidase family protein [Roseovarius sp. A-2]
MTLDITARAALWFLPFAVPICAWVALSDLRRMKIPNMAVMALLAVFVVVGVLVLPFGDYAWRFAHLAIFLVLGILANAIGLMGAGDAKFIAVAAPFVALGDAATVCLLFASVLIAAFASHRIAMHSPLRRLAPDWTSWQMTKKFPMGLALGPTLALYLGLGAIHGS